MTGLKIAASRKTSDRDFYLALRASADPAAPAAGYNGLKWPGKKLCGRVARPLSNSPRRCMTTPLAYKIAVLVFLENTAGEQLLLLRAKPPNLGVWSPIGGKLETAIGESPFECAVRETQEEIGLEITTADLHLFAMIAEKAYEGESHWLMFLFRCRCPITELPPEILEGRFGFFSREAIDSLPIPETDRTALWPTYDRYRDRFVALKADCAPNRPVRVEIEEITPS